MNFNNITLEQLIILGGGVGIIWKLKDYLFSILLAGFKQCYVSVKIAEDYNTSLFDALNNKIIKCRRRKTRYDHTYFPDLNNESRDYSIRSGFQIFFKRWHPIIIIKTVRKKEGMSNIGVYKINQTEYHEFFIIGFKESHVKKYLNELEDEIIKQKEINSTKSIYTNFENSFTHLANMSHIRKIDSIIINNEIKKKLLHDIDNFFLPETKKAYNSIGTPYRRTYLFYGPPGVGKTSMVKALADRLKSDIFILDFDEMTSKNLIQLINNIPPKSILLIEDIDKIPIFCIETDSKYSTIKMNDDKSISKSALLNVLDGVFNESNEIVTIMTTNDIDKLDPIVIREGRVDVKVLFEHPDHELKEIYVSNKLKSKIKLNYKIPYSTYPQLQDSCNTEDINKWIISRE